MVSYIPEYIFTFIMIDPKFAGLIGASLSVSQRIKEAGVTNLNATWWWTRMGNSEEYFLLNQNRSNVDIAAPNVDDIVRFVDLGMLFTCDRKTGLWHCHAHIYNGYGETIHDAAGEALIDMANDLH
jgi:hypothetical protein